MESFLTREIDFYLDIKDKKDFLDFLTVNHKCTDLQIKFINSVMDGKVKFVKHALNIGSIRKNYDIRREAINLACRFGQPEVLDLLLHEVHDNFFKVEDLNFVAVVVAGTSEARRLEGNQEPSGILDTLIKYARKSFDKRKLHWVNGKIELDWTAFEKYETTPFMELCRKKSRCMSYVIKKILDAEPYLLDVNEVIGETSSEVGNSALTHAIMMGEQEVTRIILDKMKWERSTDLDSKKYNQNHIQRFLAECIEFLSDPFESTEMLLFAKREDRMDIIQILIEKCFRVTQENNIGHNNAGFMKEFEEELFVHDHFGAMVYDVIEEERRIAHAGGKITWYDLYDLKLVEGPWTKHGHGPSETQDRDFYGDQLKRYIRSSDKEKVILCDEVTVYNIDILLTELEKKEKCETCGYRDPSLLVCKQCRKARYCDALCQEEDWGKHQQFCKDQKNQLKQERQSQTVNERKSIKRMPKNTKTGLDEISLGWSQMITEFQTLCYRAHIGEYN